MDLKIQPIAAYTPEHYHLLLDADPSLASIATYLSRSTAFELTSPDTLLGIIVIMPLAHRTAEIMNISIHPGYRNQHLASHLLQFIIDQYRDDLDFNRLRIKTGTTSFAQLYLYQKFGFRCQTILHNYFQNRSLYPEDIYENKLLLKDAIVLERDLGSE